MLLLSERDVNQSIKIVRRSEKADCVWVCVIKRQLKNTLMHWKDPQLSRMEKGVQSCKMGSASLGQWLYNNYKREFNLWPLRAAFCSNFAEKCPDSRLKMTSTCRLKGAYPAVCNLWNSKRLQGDIARMNCEGSIKCQEEPLAGRFTNTDTEGPKSNSRHWDFELHCGKSIPLLVPHAPPSRAPKNASQCALALEWKSAKRPTAYPQQQAGPLYMLKCIHLKVEATQWRAEPMQNALAWWSWAFWSLRRALSCLVWDQPLWTLPLHEILEFDQKNNSISVILGMTEYQEHTIFTFIRSFHSDPPFLESSNPFS